jgi:ligand-binding sensor domain-containing protein/signal transduction histidine kinase
MFPNLKIRCIVGSFLALIFMQVFACFGEGVNASTIDLPYTRTSWGISAGLPEDTVQAIVESDDGLLWIGTTGGLTRFDGAHLQLWGTGGQQPLPVNSIFCLTRSRDGSLLAGTEGGGLLRLRGNSLNIYSSKDGLTDGFVRSVLEDERGRIWIGTDNGLFVLEHGHIRRIHETAGIAPLAVHSIAEDRDHRIWVGGSSLLTIDPDGHQHEYALPGAYSKNRVKKVLQTSDGVLWVGTVGGLQYFRNGKFQTLPGIHTTVRTLLQTSDGTLWIGTIGDGLWTFRDGQLLKVSRPGLLPSNTVLSIFEDSQKQVWIGTQAGLVRLNKTPVRVVTLPEGSDPDYETISGDNHGDLWVASQRLYLIRDDKAQPVIYGNLKNITVRNIMRARDGALWIGTDGSGAYRILDNNVTHYSAPAKLTNNFVRGFLEARNGSMWIATDEGVTRIGPHGVQKLTEADGLAYSSTRSLVEDRKGGIWIGTDRGLSHWQNGAFRQGVVTRLLAREKIWSILEDRRGVLWFGTRDHGLFRYSGGTAVQFTTTQGLPSNSVYQILQDRKGKFWVTSPNMIASLGETEMDSSHPTEDHPVSATVYTMPYGADGAQMYGGRQPSGYLAPDDTVWFPSNRGAVHVTEVEDTRGTGPRADIDEISEDGSSLPVTSQLWVPAHIARLSFGFGAVFLRSQEGVRFRYKLENFDKAWNVASAGRSATYTNLHAGRYVFRVVTFDAANPSQISEADVVVVKAPFFYETWWFYLFCGLVIASLIWMIYRFRVGQIRTRFRAVLEERGRLAREMHDTVIQGCTGISALLEAIATTGDDDRGSQRELLDYARVQVRTTIDEARHAVWNMRHDQEPAVDIVEGVRGIALQTMREFGNVVRFDFNRDSVELGASAGHEILMIVREAIYNSVQHSGIYEVDLRMEATSLELAITVTDQGCGFHPDDPHLVEQGHYGIVGMRERMQRLGGVLEVTSSPGAGTVVRLLLSHIDGTRQYDGSNEFHARS